jgi:hypothetical protein
VAYTHSRRQFIKQFSLGAASLPFVMNLPCFGFESEKVRKQRLVVMFSPNGVVQQNFWPDEEGSEFTLKESLAPLEPWKDRTLILKGLSDKLKGDGDRHMRGIGCLLTGIELFPGNIQGGSDTPAGWSKGISLDQELKKVLQSREETRTRFGSLEFGVLVPERADTWTRLSYEGPNKPVAPIDDPYQMFDKMYGRLKDSDSLKSVIDAVQADLRRLKPLIGKSDRQLLEQHETLVRELEQELRASTEDIGHAVPKLEPGVREDNDNMPAISKMQIDLMINGFVADFTRIATLQYTNSVGQAKMRWLDVQEGHHELSHKPDDDQDAQTKLTKINKWYCEQLAYLTRRLAETPEPGGEGSLLDNTTIVWTNELGKGNSHSLDNIPFVLIGNGLDFKMGRSLKLKNVAHNRLLLSISHQMGHRIDTFGNPNLCGDGPISGLT